MASLRIEETVRELHQVVSDLVTKVERLERVISEQNTIIKNQCEVLAMTTNTSVTVADDTSTHKDSDISVPALTNKQKVPIRLARTRAVSAITAMASGRKKGTTSATTVFPTSAAHSVCTLHDKPLDQPSSDAPVTHHNVTKAQLSVSSGTAEVQSGTLNEKWVEVKSRRSRGPPANVLKGTATPGTMTIEAAERWKYLHLYFVKEGTTDDIIRDHLTQICKQDVCIVESLKPRGKYASFKISVPVKMEGLVMSSANWPEDICIKPWRRGFRKPSDI